MYTLNKHKMNTHKVLNLGINKTEVNYFNTIT